MALHGAVGLLLKRQHERADEERDALRQQVHPDIERTQFLIEEFLQMLCSDGEKRLISGSEPLS
jgi:hypothetical protein